MSHPIELAEATRIECRLEAFEWRFPMDEAARIEAHWVGLRTNKPGLFDGLVLMSRALTLTDDVLRGSAFATNYKAFISWRDFGWPDAGVHNLFAMPALRSADGAFLLGRMSGTTANAGRLYFPAGTPEPSDVGANGLVDFDANILRELEEETGLGAADVSLAAVWTIVFAGPLVACMKVAQSTLSARALAERVAAFIAEQAMPELDGLVAVRRPSDYDPANMPAFMLRYLDAALDSGSGPT